MIKCNRLYEINTATYLRKLSARYGRTITLASIPDEEIARIADLGFDAIWLMGIWRRSHAAVELALANQPLIDEARALLPDFTIDDIVGSAYSIQSYEINEQLGNEAELAQLRQKLSAHGLGLILDFVPNHTGFDHDWVTTRPDNYIMGDQEQLSNHPDQYRQRGDHIIANGRDPKLGSWSDVAQLNAFSPSYRESSVETLNHIASLCDGVRCDMAMLLTNEIFAGTWGASAGPAPEIEYWSEVISAVRNVNPDFLFIAECYWKTNALLLGQGFDYCYDKDLYDLLVKGSAVEIVDHLVKTNGIAAHQVYFIENHDEPRAATTFTIEKQKAAAYIVNSLPGLHLVYDGQTTGYTAKIPVHLGREPDLPVNHNLADYYDRLLRRSIDSNLTWRNLEGSPILIGSNNIGIHSLVNYSNKPVEVDIATLSMDPNSFKPLTGSDELSFNDNTLTLVPWQVVETHTI